MEQLRKDVRQDLRAFRRLILKGLIALLLMVLIVGWGTDYRSCIRQAPGREAAQDEVPIAKASAAYWRAHGRPSVADRSERRARILSSEKPLDCFALLPDA